MIKMMEKLKAKLKAYGEGDKPWFNKYIVKNVKNQMKHEVPTPPKDNFDFNNDGKVDKKDVSLAGRLLGRSKKSKKTKKK